MVKMKAEQTELRTDRKMGTRMVERMDEQREKKMDMMRAVQMDPMMADC